MTEDDRLDAAAMRFAQSISMAERFAREDQDAAKNEDTTVRETREER